MGKIIGGGPSQGSVKVQRGSPRRCSGNHDARGCLLVCRAAHETAAGVRLLRYSASKSPPLRVDTLHKLGPSSSLSMPLSQTLLLVVKPPSLHVTTPLVFPRFLLPFPLLMPLSSPFFPAYPRGLVPLRPCIPAAAVEGFTMALAAARRCCCKCDIPTSAAAVLPFVAAPKAVCPISGPASFVIPEAASL